MRASQLRDLGIMAFATVLLGYLASEFMPAYPQTVLTLCGINVILAASLNLVNGFAGQFSLGHAGFMAVGAYTSAAMTTLVLPKLGVSFDTWLEPLFFSLALLSGGLAASLMGVMVGIPSLRLKGDYLAIVTLGFGEIIRIGILNIESIGGARGFGGIPLLTNMYWLFGMVILTSVFLYRLVASIPGKQFMAVRDDETAATSMGLSTTQIKVKAFVFAAFFAGIAGGLFAHAYTYLNPGSFTFNYSFQIVAMVVLGGMGSLSGSMLAAVLLTTMLEALRPLQNWTGVDLRMVIYALVLIGLMLTRPQGIFGRNEIWQIFSKRRWFARAERSAN